MRKDPIDRPSDGDAEEAIKTLIRWIGDSPDRGGLASTPKRALNAYKESFSGYKLESSDFSSSLLANEGYCDMILFKGVSFSSSCEHHMVPITGTADVAYIPRATVLGVGAMVKIVDIFAKRLQLQERLAVQVAHFLNSLLNPLGVAVLMEAGHWCFQCSGRVIERDFRLQTSCMLGMFQDDRSVRSEFFCRVGHKFS
ncbi:GTP cyclohydrolase I [Anaplasma capra]|uniref:GTP cyclohydrolase I n=1 Tax=Anaplasma capra TaxID=1562740 RepID=UPI0021D5F160|nr:GTP cyclohydrolase I [Anaplasma capra]MCU7611642.1 GTP cyclohydrolase I [Anaplasma capra]MCU7612210.1 GTP cyclohydrolase I [Anaplasma capra]